MAGALRTVIVDSDAQACATMRQLLGTVSGRSEVSKSIRDQVSTVVTPVATETLQSRPGRLLRHALFPKAVFRPG